MKHLKTLILSKWTGYALLLIFLLALIWVVGPGIAIFNWAPLETIAAQWYCTIALLVLLLLWAGLRYWVAQRRNRKVVEQLDQGAAAPAGERAALDKRFAQALHVLRNARFGPDKPRGWIDRLFGRFSRRFLYQLPWYLIIGAPGSGKTTALLKSGLHFPLAEKFGSDPIRGTGGTRLCDWWFTDQAVLIDTAGRFTTQDSDAVKDKATWNTFLGLLKTARKERPLNGVIVTVSVDDLVGNGAGSRREYAGLVRERLQEIEEQLRGDIPVYLLITKCDLLAGFIELFGDMGKDARAQPWGFTFPVSERSTVEERVHREFHLLLQRLDQGLIDGLQAEPDRTRRGLIYGFPNQFASLGPALQEFVGVVFAASPFETRPAFRGAYFVSGTQTGTAIDRVLGAAARRFGIAPSEFSVPATSARSFFLQRLLTEVIFAERNLAGGDKGVRRSLRMLRLSVIAGTAVVSIGLIFAWTLSWKRNSDYVAEVGKRVEQIRPVVEAAPNRPNSDLLLVLPALDAVRDLTAVQQAQPGLVPWTMRLGLFQGPEFDAATKAAYGEMLRQAALPRLALQARDQLRSAKGPAAQYEAFKAYLLMYEEHLKPQERNEELRRFFENNWTARVGRELTKEQFDALSGHLQALLRLKSMVSPLPLDESLFQEQRQQLASLPPAQLVYGKLREQRYDEQKFPPVSVVSAGGPELAAVFVRTSNTPLVPGVKGIFTYSGYHEKFGPSVNEAVKALASEQRWVLGPALGAGAPKLDASTLDSEVRRLYLMEYRNEWRSYLDDLRMKPLGSLQDAITATRQLTTDSSKWIEMLRRFSKETTLLAATPAAAAASSAAGALPQPVRQAISRAVTGARTAAPAPGGPVEKIVDDEFQYLRQMVTPEGGKAPVDDVVAVLKAAHTQLMTTKAALDGKRPPPAAQLTDLKTTAANMSGPVGSILDGLIATIEVSVNSGVRSALGQEISSNIGKPCDEAVARRYPFDPTSPHDVPIDAFAKLFGPNGQIVKMMSKLEPYVDFNARPSWRFLPVDGGPPLGRDPGWLPQLQAAQAIRETFFGEGSSEPAFRIALRPVEMDTRITGALLDIGGQAVKYDHGPVFEADIRWPSGKGNNTVQLTLQPTGGSKPYRGPWALQRLFESAIIVPGASPNKFRATFDFDGRKITFEITTGVRNPLRLPEVKSFRCPMGL